MKLSRITKVNPRDIWKHEAHDFTQWLAKDENIEILKNLINYFNENLKKIGKMYNCVYPGITTTKYLYVHNLETANLKE